ncbi:MAG TPA: hypothetical protein VF173_21465 [Thermoanaerobaculia bacterium]|nr:hypothetical protein [Thermoanaerobaculia bacterium]
MLLADRAVFLNIPFDSKYRPLFIALIAGLAALGSEPHCVLEVPSAGRNRLDRIYGLIESCGSSIHDLSRVSLSGKLRVPRFNMPFELGLAYSIGRRQDHSFFVLERVPHRLQATLSDLNGHDPHIHHGTQDGIYRCILDCFGTSGREPSITTLRSLGRRLGQVVAKLEREQALRDPFHPYVFRQAVRVAAEFAQAEGLLRFS